MRGRELTIIEGGKVVMAVADDSVLFVYLDNTFADIALPGPPPDYRRKRRQRMTAIVDTRPWWTVADAGGILAFTSNGGHERWINPRIPEVVRVFDKAPSARQSTPAELAAFEAALGKDPEPRKRDD
ncbi:MAG: hypothetical protein IPK87_13335 [Planctomycetes bacterium]|nr:hypothetical protein [Planctomycetota bacterium]